MATECSKLFANSPSIEEELKKNPELKMSDIAILREWCEKQRHLPKVTDFFLAMILHSNFYSLEGAKSTIENYFTMKTFCPEFFADRDPLGSKEFRRIFNVIGTFELKGKSKDGCNIFYARLIDTDPAHYNYTDATKYFFMAADSAVWRTGTCKGYRFVCDGKGVSLGHIGRISLVAVKKSVAFLQEAIPVRLVGIHFINAPPAIDTFMTMAKPFMNSKLMNMIHFHSTLESLEEFLPTDILPNESGGKAGSLLKLNNETIKDLDDNREWFLEEERIWRTNENLRVGETKSANSLFGCDGSFKKIEVD